MYGSKTHQELSVVPKPVPAGIPGKKMAPNAYTGLEPVGTGITNAGLGFDQVGPALYNPKADAHKKVSA